MAHHESETRNRILAATRRLMEQQRGQGVRMQDIAREAGVSRQAVYLHFGSRAELLVATTHYVDEVCGLDERARRWESAPTGVGLLEAYVDFWGNYIPEVYGMAKALLADRETDEAAALAWNNRMGAVRNACRFVIESLDGDGMLAPEWSVEEAVDLMWTLVSVRNWEHLTIECGWTKDQYIQWMQQMLKRTFVARESRSHTQLRNRTPVTSYTFTRKKALFPTPSNIPGPGPYYTCLVPMGEVISFPYDYALYFSSDHDPDDGGIWLYLCNGEPTDASNWVSYEDAVAAADFDHLADKPISNPIFIDSVQGNGHTETPHANVIDGTVYMSYHKNGIDHTQRTLLATSPDGVNFSRINGDADSVILTYHAETDAGNGHTGYFRWSTSPFPGIDQKYVGYSLHGGGDSYYSAIWASDDAISWERLDILTPIEGFAVEGEDSILIWHEIDPASISRLDNGEFVAICGVGNRASGGVARITELYEIFLAEDGRTLTRACRQILGIGGTDSPDAEELASPTSITIGDTCHLIYVGASEEGSVNTVLGATGKLGTRSSTSQALTDADRTRHIYHP